MAGLVAVVTVAVLDDDGDDDGDDGDDDGTDGTDGTDCTDCAIEEEEEQVSTVFFDILMDDAVKHVKSPSIQPRVRINTRTNHSLTPL